MKKHVLSVNSSVLLDLIRFCAALVVLYSHFAHESLATHLRSGVTAGNLAVSVFFVLSGFVIRFVTVARRANLRRYTVDRASRIYSVVIPAIAISFLCKAIGTAVNSARFNQLELNSHAGALWTILCNLSFTSQIWGYEINPPNNGPFWSIAYEVIYYAVYGLFFYRVRLRWALALLLVLIAGPSIAFNGLFWWLGCLTYDVFARWKDRRQALPSAAIFATCIVLLIAVARHPIVHVIALTEKERRLSWTTHTILTAFPSFQALTVDGQLPWLERLSISFLVASVLTAAFMLVSLLLLERVRGDVPRSIASVVRIVADSTFTLYLVHLPTLDLIGTLMGHPVTSVLAKLAIPGSIILVCIPLSRALDHFKRWLRETLLSVTEAPPEAVETSGEAARSA